MNNCFTILSLGRVTIFLKWSKGRVRIFLDPLLVRATTSWPKFFLRLVVPLGSVLGPLLFFKIFINDIYLCSNKLGFYLFADDTNLLYADENLKSLETVVNAELKNVCDWLNANKLTINAKKSNYVVFRPGQKRIIRHESECALCS